MRESPTPGARTHNTRSKSRITLQSMAEYSTPVGPYLTRPRAVADEFAMVIDGKLTPIRTTRLVP